MKAQTQKVLSSSVWSCWPVFRKSGWLRREPGGPGEQGVAQRSLFSSCLSLSCNWHLCVRVFITQSSQAAKHSWENQPALSPDSEHMWSTEDSERVSNRLRDSDVAGATGKIKRSQSCVWASFCGVLIKQWSQSLGSFKETVWDPDCLLLSSRQTGFGSAVRSQHWHY